ncbi:MAG: DUF928 domain-containing protein [Cyanomargarita calcarea GSE-NOS-MK-12-04C]|jgi:hypothetical protein|uniref:DUF928 domain-containing protein n=1 Tax=Cyanomargarita calcarea GSE-NOS-MK-12-04C TaxID=2839659 RepID=A0A951QRH8_9CYAN|nr:DUF928 domain-containing protein [Cyanomargarita calcarea GSE-NOS-MK-12-04C]
MKILVEHRMKKKFLAATLGLSFLIPFSSAEARIKFNAPTNLGVPGRRVAGGARKQQDSCISRGELKPLTALVPKSNVGLTTAANPVLFFYIPQTSRPLELVVQDENQKSFKQTYKSSGKAGIVGLPLTKTSLKVGSSYRWFLSVVCNPTERSNDRVVDGTIKRIQPSELLTKLNNATPTQRVNIYAEAGIWQDSLATLAALRLSNPNNAQLKSDWTTLLSAESVGLRPESTEPLLQGREAPQPN